MNKKGFSLTLMLRTVSLLLVFSLFFVGCGQSKPTTSEPDGSDPISSVGNKTTEQEHESADNVISDTVSSEQEKVYDTETIIEYYDDEYTTSPSSWTTSSSGQKTVQNLPAYSFKEENYINANFGGGTNVRTEDFTRGMGITRYYSTANSWGGLPSFDEPALKELGVNSTRAWNETTKLGFNSAQNMTYVDTVSGCLNGIATCKYADGSNGTTCFSSPDFVSQFLKNINVAITTPSILNNKKFMLLGNEYRYLNRNGSGNYAWAIYDSVTLNDFRNNWLKSRFKTISNFNKLCDTAYKSFDEVMPQVNQKVFYECWLFLRQTFRDKMEMVVTKAKEISPDLKWGYATYYTKNNPLSDYLNLDFLDYSSANMYTYTDDKYNYREFTFSLDNLVGWSTTSPAMITEHGIPNGFTTESKNEAARKYLQTLNLMYMRPRVSGVYIYNYTNSGNQEREKNWGVVSPDRKEKFPCYDSVAEIYNNFMYLDKFYTGASNTPLVAVSNNSSSYINSDKSLLSANITKTLYAQGVPVEIFPIDDASRVNLVTTDKIIIAESSLYENPDGSDSVVAALNNAMNKGTKVLNYGLTTSSIYGKNYLNTNNNNYAESAVISSDFSKSWKTLGKYIHGDFIAGKIKTDTGKINENAVRILESYSWDNESLRERTYDISMQMVYNNGHMYLCVVNESETPIKSIDITLGVNNGVRCNLDPHIMRGGKYVSVSRPARANIPSYIDSSMKSKVAYGTITVSNLDTYAYIDLGMAILQ